MADTRDDFGAFCDFVQTNLEQPIELHPWQREVLESIARGDRVTVVFPTRTGQKREARRLVQVYRELRYEL